jgi:hypothetical protein
VDGGLYGGLYGGLAAYTAAYTAPINIGYGHKQMLCFYIKHIKVHRLHSKSSQANEN